MDKLGLKAGKEGEDNGVNDPLLKLDIGATVLTLFPACEDFSPSSGTPFDAYEVLDINMPDACTLSCLLSAGPCCAFALSCLQCARRPTG